MRLTDSVRLRTWALEITRTLLGEAGTVHGHDTRFPGRGGLDIHNATGAWHCHAEARGGYSAISLVAFLKGCSSQEAEAWGAAWLLAHQGEGFCTGAGSYDDTSKARIAANDATARAVLAAAIPLTDPRSGPVGAYLASRGLAPPYPESLRCLPDTWLEELHRPGEVAVVAELHAHGASLGVHLTWVDPYGVKSLHQPIRETFLFADPRAKAAVFSLQVPNSEVWNPTDAPDRIACEGIEDALSCAAAKLAPTIHATLGAGRLKHVEVPRGTHVVHFRDGDDAGAATAGIDELLLRGATVRVTDTPPDVDPNSLLQSGGVDALRELVAAAAPAELSINGEAVRLARLEQVEYDQQRAAIAKKFGIRVATLDDKVKQVRPRQSDAEHRSTIPVDEVWEGDVELGAVLDQALVQVRRYIVAEATLLATLVVWSAHTHVVHSDAVKLQRSPRLAIQSRVKGCGKTTTLEIVRELSASGELLGSYSASAIFRSLDSNKRTYCLDETDRILHDTNSELVAILNQGDRRASARVTRSVPTPDGGWRAEVFFIWGAVAFAGIDELPETLQDRSVCIRLQKVLAHTVPEHLRDGTAPELVDIRRQLTAWGSALTELPDPEMPGVFRHRAGRVGDCWRPLIAIADLAGGQWPELIRAAAVSAAGASEQQSELERLLSSIRLAFEAQAEQDQARCAAGDKSDDRTWPDSQHRLRTNTLLATMLADQAEEWNVVNRGRPVSAYWLKSRLRHLLTPPGAQDWWTGPAGKQTHHRGYLQSQFSKVWETHLAVDGPYPSSSPWGSSLSGVSGVSTEVGAKNPAKPPVSATPDAAPEPQDTRASSVASGVLPMPDKPLNSLNKDLEHATATPDTPDTPDAQEGKSGKGEAGVEVPTGAASAEDGNGVRRRRPRALSPAVIAARELAIEHPDWSPARIARKLGIAEPKVRTALKTWVRSDAAP